MSLDLLYYGLYRVFGGLATEALPVITGNYPRHELIPLLLGLTKRLLAIQIDDASQGTLGKGREACCHL